MASSKEYLEFILGQLSDLNEITYRAMMGEFVIYYCLFVTLKAIATFNKHSYNIYLINTMNRQPIYYCD